MKTLPLGTTGVEVSALCLGTMHFGSREDKETSFQLLDQFAEGGGTFLDTANMYATWITGQGGESELTLGQWLKARSNRPQMFVATKVGQPMPGVERGLPADRIEAECEKSLKRLGVETIDLYYAHLDDPNTPLEETLEAFNRLVQAGKVRFLGASNFYAWRLLQAKLISEARGWAGYCAIQQRYSYLRLKPGANYLPLKAIDHELLELCADTQITPIAYGALLKGTYTRSDRPVPDQYAGPDSDARLIVLKQVAAEVEATPNQVVLAWMLHSKPAVLPIIGASRPEQMQENLEAVGVTLTAEQVARLDEAMG